MHYLPHTPKDIEEMLSVIGVSSISDLFSGIPETLRLEKPLGLPRPLSEQELRSHLQSICKRNSLDWSMFLGGGAYRHHIPAVVPYLAGRGEFLTSYTPYQPEASQGTLQALFEFQTMVSEIFGMEIANASNYDGASAVAEAVIMARRLNLKRRSVLVSSTLHPEYRETIKTYLRYTDVEIKEIQYDKKSSHLDREGLGRLDDVICLVAGYPNFFGVIEDLSDIAQSLHSSGSLLVTATTEPWALAIARTPGEMGADIAVGEGKSFGLPLNYGGPGLGMFATRRDFMRQIPGRIVGETTDSKGKRGYVLTLSTREQHIRRGRATSNICTNSTLCAIGATITLSLVGKEGFRDVASINLKRAEGLKKRLCSAKGVKPLFAGTTFNEFALYLDDDPAEVLKRLRSKKILGGLPLKRWYPELENGLLVCATEMNTEEEIENYASCF